MRPDVLAVLALVVVNLSVASAQNISTAGLPSRNLTITGAQILTNAYLDTNQLFSPKLFPLDDGKSLSIYFFVSYQCNTLNINSYWTIINLA